MDLFVGEWRKKRGISQAELARLAGISRQTLWAIEEGETNRPHRKTVLALARILRCEMAHLYQPPPADLGPVQPNVP